MHTQSKVLTAQGLSHICDVTEVELVLLSILQTSSFCMTSLSFLTFLIIHSTQKLILQIQIHFRSR